MSAIRNLSLATLWVFTAACSGGDEAKTLTGDLSGAIGLAISKPALEPATFAFGGDDDDAPEPEAFFTLVKIDSNGNIDHVFNQQRPIAHVSVTDTHVVVSGDFRDVKTADGGGTHCVIVSFPRTATGEAVKCLSKNGPGRWPANLPGHEGSVAQELPGIATRGSAVLFTDSSVGDVETHLRRWESGADETELLLQLSGGTKLEQPWTTDASNYLCVNSGGGVGEFSTVYCSVATGTPNWADSGASMNSAAMILGTNLIAQDTGVSLSDGSLLATNNRMPTSYADFLVVGTSAIGIAGGGSGSFHDGDLYRYYADGSALAIDVSVDWERILGAGNFGYVYGQSQLKRVDLRTAVIGTANLLGSVGLVQVVDFSFTTDGNLRLDGTTSTGLPGVVLVNTSSGELTVTQEDIPRFQAVTPLE